MHLARAGTIKDSSWVLVTGVEHATARAVAMELASSWNIVAHSFALNEARAVAEDIRRAGGNAHPVEADLTVAVSASRMYAELRADGPAITALVHSASLPGPESTAHPLRQIHPSDWYRFIHLHLSMLLHTVRGAIDTIDTNATTGAILTVTSSPVTQGQATTLARATVDGATAAFAAALANENRDPSLTVCHLRSQPGAHGTPYATGVSSELRAALECRVPAATRVARSNRLISR
ncbi:hypothetical protein BH11ACT6_BH11ACT6_08790 [soil metagenome]